MGNPHITQAEFLLNEAGEQRLQGLATNASMLMARAQVEATLAVAVELDRLNGGKLWNPATP
jgi:hypothetical protein